MRQPTPKFSDNEKRLLKLMAKLLIEAIDAPSVLSNTKPSEIVLTDEEATELMHRIEQLTNSTSFTKACYLVEGLTQPFDVQKNKQLREIYLSQRQRNGRTRAMGSMHWLNFRARAGLPSEETSRSPIEPMDLDYFNSMEYRLLRSSDIPDKAIDLLMSIVRQQKHSINMTRLGHMPIRHGSIKQKIIEPILQWGKRANYILQDRNISTHRIASAILIVTDIGALFTTRDWGAAGFLSVIAGATIETTHD